MDRHDRARLTRVTDEQELDEEVWVYKACQLRRVLYRGQPSWILRLSRTISRRRQQQQSTGSRTILGVGSWHAGRLLMRARC